MAYLFLSERRARRLHHGRAVLGSDHPAAGKPRELQIGASEDRRHSRRTPCRGRIDPGDLRMGMRAAQDMGMELSGPVDVVGVGAPAGNEPDVFLAPHARADAHTVNPPVARPRESIHKVLPGKAALASSLHLDTVYPPVAE